MPPWQYALAGLMALVIFAVCLFPLAPAWLRSVVVYFFLGLLCGIFALILVRFLLFLVVFAFLGAPPPPSLPRTRMCSWLRRPAFRHAAVPSRSSFPHAER